MANVKFSRGLLNSYLGLANKNADTVYITTDEGGIYLGSKRLGDIVVTANYTELQNKYDVTKVSPSTLFYMEAENILARSNGSAWVQINAQGLTSVEVTGSGNAVTGVTASATGKVTFNKGETFATSSDLNSATGRIKTLEDDMAALTGGADGTGSISDQINAAKNAVLGTTSDAEGAQTVHGANKNADAAQATADAAKQQATTNAGEIATMKTNISNNADAIATEKGRIDTLTAGVSTDYNTLAKLEGKIKANAEDIAENVGAIEALETAVNTKNNTQDQAIQKNKDDIATNTLAIAKLNGGANETGSVLNTVNTQIAAVVDGAPDAFDTLKEIADWIGSDEAGTGAAETLANHGNRLDTVEDTVEGHTTSIGNNADAIAELSNKLNKEISDRGTEDAATLQSAKDYTDAAKTAILGDAAAGYNTLGQIEDKLIEHNGSISTLTTNLGDLQSDYNAHVQAYQAHIEAYNTLNTNFSNYKTTNDAAVDGVTQRVATLEVWQGNMNTWKETVNEAITWGSF